MNSLVKDIVSREERAEWASRLASIGTSIKSLAASLVEMVDRDSETISKISHENSGIDVGFLRKVERYGRGKLHEAFIFDCSMAARAAAYLPYETQKKIVSGFIPVAISANSKPAQKRLSELKPQEVYLAIDSSNHCLRPIADQKRILSQREQAEKTIQKRWEVRGDGLWVYANPLTMNEVKAALDQIVKLEVSTIGSHLKRSQILRNP